MNFFSHFFVDHISGNHPYNTGLLLPDITRGRIDGFRKPYEKTDTIGQQFYRGCQAHYYADKQFHGSTFFTEMSAKALDCLNKAPFSPAVHRKWFIAHILTELMIDRILVGQYRNLLDEFYQSLSTAGDEHLSHFLLYFGMKDIDSFFEFFNHFRSVQYIHYYTDNNKFVYSLNRIVIRAGVGSLSEEDQTVLLNAALQFEMEIGLTPEALGNQLIKSVHA